MKKILSILMLLVAFVTSAQAYYTPTSDEVIVLDYIRDVNGANTGYSTHSAISWAASPSSTSKSRKCGDPYNNGELTSDERTCYSAKGNGGGKNITVSVTGVSKIIVYHAAPNSGYLELRNGSKTGSLIGETTGTGLYTELELSPSTEYNIFLHGTDGSSDQDVYVYAIKLIASAAPTTTEPVVLTQPKDVIYILGSSIYPEMSVTAKASSAGGALSYKWFANFGASDIDLSLILGEAATSSTISFEDVKDYVPQQYMVAGFSFTMYCQVTEEGVADPIVSETATATIVDPSTPVDVTEAATWDWSKYGTNEIKLSNTTTPAKGEDFLLATLPLYGYAAPAADFGNAAQLVLNTEYVVRNGSFMQGYSVKFNTTVGGTVKVYYSNTGGNRPYRHIWVNGTLSAEGSASSNAVMETEEIPVAAGEVEIKAYIPDATNPQEGNADVEGFAPVRIYKIEFTPLTQLVITTQPSDVTYAMGTTDYPTATVEAIASAGELTYEWRYRSSQYAFYPLPDSNSPTLDFADYTTGVIGGKLEEEGSYVFYCAVTDDNGTSYSEDFTLTVAEGVATVTLNSKGYATFSCAEKVEVATQGVTVYYASGLADGKLTISPKPTGNIVTWDEGVILVGEPGTVVSFISSDGNGDPAPDNLLHPTTTSTGELVDVPQGASGSDALTLDGSTFKWFQGNTFNANRAYLMRSEIVDAMNGSNSLEIVFDTPTTVGTVAEVAPIKVAPIKVIKGGKLYIGNYNIAGQLIK